MAVSRRAEWVEAEAGGLVRPVRHQHLRPLVRLHRQGRGLQQQCVKCRAPNIALKIPLVDRVGYILNANDLKHNLYVMQT